MDVKQAYREWSGQYDTNDNKTRDLEAVVLRETLSVITFDTCLELGCGTGKNTEWLITRAKEIIAVDLTDEMLDKAKEKVKSEKVVFMQADITRAWEFVRQQFDLVTFSLVLEHIEDLPFIFRQLSKTVSKGGYVYIGELHPFKQYLGTKARFETTEGQQIVTCFTHHLSDFILPAKKFGFDIITVNEYFDQNDKSTTPRIMSILLRNP